MPGLSIRLFEVSRFRVDAVVPGGGSSGYIRTSLTGNVSLSGVVSYFPRTEP